MSHEWDARAYDTFRLPHTLWGRRTLAGLEPSGLSTVLDAGCGTGRDTELLLGLSPNLRVVAVDASRAMLDQLERRLPDRLARVDIVCADLAQPLFLQKPVDAIVSVAAFHWISDHGALFRNLADVLRPNGQLVADCGGSGNVAAIVAAIEDVLGETDDIWNFAGIDETHERLADAGFTDIDVTLRRDSGRLESVEQFESYLATVVLGAHMSRLPESERIDFVRAVRGSLSEPVVDYVRLEISARRAPE